MNDEIIDSIRGTKIILSDNDTKKQFDIAGIFSIDENDLSREYSMQASLFAYFSVLSAKSERNLSVSKLASEREYAVADQQIREDLVGKDVKATESMIKQLISADEEYCALQDTVVAAEYERDLLKAIARSLEMRANMLISLGALRRHEIDMTDMSIRRASFDKTVDDTKESLRRLRSQKDR
ncbi:MAG TPA: hypothetical protein VJ044_03640 [Candidatus Hodarchaeales archaeon]|nr:hypothetical protein [Candidatus Hodarchaeales archaeon]